MDTTSDPTDRPTDATQSGTAATVAAPGTASSETATAQPGAAATASGPGTAATTTARSGNQWGRISMVLGLVSLLGGGIVAGLIGSTIAQQQAEAGRLLSDTPESYQTLVTLGLGSFLVWSLIALAALITGIVALVRKERLGGALTGILTGLFAPAVWFAAFAISAVLIASALS